MNENIMDNSIIDAQNKLDNSELVETYSDNGEHVSISGGDSLGSGCSDISVEGGLTASDIVPVMVVAQADNSLAVGTGNGYQLPSYYVEYFKGVLDNIGDTDYVAFCTREYYNNYNYIEHYRLVYDVTVDNNTAVVDTYPCLDIYRDSNNNYYNVLNTFYTLSEIPSFSYGSFGTYSDMREGMNYGTTYALLFFLGFYAVYSVCHDIFDYIMDKIYRR